FLRTGQSSMATGISLHSPADVPVLVRNSVMGCVDRDGRAVPVGDALDVRLQVVVRHHRHLGPEGGAAGVAGVEAAPGEVLRAGVAAKDLREDALLHGVHVGGQLFDEPELLD
ncbi:hypothetical protein EE612_040254, partial [Oryza sativa]